MAIPSKRTLLPRGNTLLDSASSESAPENVSSGETIKNKKVNAQADISNRSSPYSTPSNAFGAGSTDSSGFIQKIPRFSTANQLEKMHWKANIQHQWHHAHNRATLSSRMVARGPGAPPSRSKVLGGPWYMRCPEVRLKAEISSSFVHGRCTWHLPGLPQHAAWIYAECGGPWGAPNSSAAGATRYAVSPIRVADAPECKHIQQHGGP